jgi:hypothetical protein
MLTSSYAEKKTPPKAFDYRQGQAKEELNILYLILLIYVTVGISEILPKFFTFLFFYLPFSLFATKKIKGKVLFVEICGLANVHEQFAV